MNWDDYQPLDVLNEFIESLAASNPDFARIISIGQSYEGRDMKLLAVEKVSSRDPRLLHRRMCLLSHFKNLSRHK